MVLYVLDVANWDEVFMPSFSRSVDGLIRDIKPGVNETVVVATLTGDFLQHNSALVSEESLQKYSLSDLDGKGYTYLLISFFAFRIILVLVTCFLFYFFSLGCSRCYLSEAGGCCCLTL